MGKERPMRRPLAVVTLTATAALLGAAVLPGAASAGSDSATHPHGRVVKLTGKQEVPGPGDRDGKGFFAWQVKHWRLCYVITAKRIKPATMAHIHKGAKGVAGPIVVALKAPTDGKASGCIKAVKRQTSANAMTTLTWAELRGIVKHRDQYYANVHNAKYPAGAIRGQLGQGRSMTTDPPEDPYDPPMDDPYDPGNPGY